MVIKVSQFDLCFKEIVPETLFNNGRLSFWNQILQYVFTYISLREKIKKRRIQNMIVRFTMGSILSIIPKILIEFTETPDLVFAHMHR